MENKQKKGNVLGGTITPTYHGEYIKFFDDLLSMSDAEIDEVLNSKTVNKLYYYKQAVYYYIKHKSRTITSFDELVEIEARLNSHLYQVANQKIVNNKIQEQLRLKSLASLAELDKTMEANKLIRSLIKSDYKSLDHFCEMNSVDRKKLEENIKLIARNDQVVYAAVIDKIKMVEKPIKDHMAEVANNMLFGLANGIEIGENKTRKYDLLDYYMATNISLTDFLVFIRGAYSKAEQNKIINFVSPQNYCKPIEGSVHDIIIKMPKDGILTEISNAEKDIAITFLEQNQIPVYYLTFQTALRRHVNGLLIEEVRNVKTLNIK